MSNQQTEPTLADIDTLVRALDPEERFDSGIFCHGGAQTADFRKLCRFGMLKFTGEWGFDIDREIDGDVPIYRLTQQGRAWVEAREAAAMGSARCRVTGWSKR